MAEYYADLVISNEIEEWLLLQGATVLRSNASPYYSRSGWIVPRPDVYFSGRKIHYYAGNENQVRVFFNDETKSTISLLMMKWPEAVFKHNFLKDEQ